MPVTIMLPTALRPYAAKAATVELEARTVGEALAELARRHPSLAPHLFAEGGALRNFVNVFVNDEDCRYLERQATPLKEGDVLMIVPAVAGGSTAVVAREVDPSARDRALLTRDETERYSRHLSLPEVGIEGQLRLKQASVLLVGTGGLGSPLALYLAAAGVGRLGLVDFDTVDLSNLQRQVIHTTASVGRPKLASARAAIAALNPHVRVDTYETSLTSQNAFAVLRDYDVVADGTDNFPTRYLVNDACVLTGKPNVYGSILRFEGQASVFDVREGPCYRCLYPEPPPPGLVPSCAEGGVLGILPGIVGLIQATETIKLILGQGRSLVGRLLLFDALEMKFREMRLRKNPDCPLCGERPTITGLIDYNRFCGLGGERMPPGPEEQISAVELKEELDRHEDLLILDVREPHEYEIARLPGSRLIPLKELARRLDELDPSASIVVHCKMGGRSARATRILKDAGFQRVRNLTGGILAWSSDVDPSVRRY